MLKRYEVPEMRAIWDEDNKFHYWLKVEIAVLGAKVRAGKISIDIPDDLFNRIIIDPEEINRIEREETNHDVVAFLQHVSPQLPDVLRSHFHKGLTSYDVGDTTTSLQMRDSLKILIGDLESLMRVIEKSAKAYKYMPQMGRTHGIHAEPITFGIKLANWYSELARQRERLYLLKEMVAFGKISGAVGMYTLDPAIEKDVCEELELMPVVATQIIARDIITEYVSTLANVGASVAKIALNIRLLAQTDVGEVMEASGEKQKGSSAMPHKRNPMRSERVCGIARILFANVVTAYQNHADCWLERSLDNSAPERVILPDSSHILSYILRLLKNVIENLQVFPERMRKNLERTNGVIFSQEVMMLVAEKSGSPREEVHTWIRDIALRCMEADKDFLSTLLKDQMIMSYVTKEEIGGCFSLEEKTKYVDEIFEKVFDC